jgi:hypothetical protein
MKNLFKNAKVSLTTFVNIFEYKRGQSPIYPLVDLEEMKRLLEIDDTTVKRLRKDLCEGTTKKVIYNKGKGPIFDLDDPRLTPKWKNMLAHAFASLNENGPNEGITFTFASDHKYSKILARRDVAGFPVLVGWVNIELGMEPCASFMKDIPIPDAVYEAYDKARRISFYNGSSYFDDIFVAYAEAEVLYYKPGTIKHKLPDRLLIGMRNGIFFLIAGWDQDICTVNNSEYSKHEIEKWIRTF